MRTFKYLLLTFKHVHLSIQNLSWIIQNALVRTLAGHLSFIYIMYIFLWFIIYSSFWRLNVSILCEHIKCEYIMWIYFTWIYYVYILYECQFEYITYIIKYIWISVWWNIWLVWWNIWSNGSLELLTNVPKQIYNKFKVFQLTPHPSPLSQFKGGKGKGVADCIPRRLYVYIKHIYVHVSVHMVLLCLWQEPKIGFAACSVQLDSKYFWICRKSCIAYIEACFIKVSLFYIYSLYCIMYNVCT